MGQLDHKWYTILKLFFNNPFNDFQIRELSRATKIPKTTVQRAIQELRKQKLVLCNRKGVFPSYCANQTHFWYKFYKKNHLLEEVYRSGLIDYLEEFFHPQCIILFGSGAKGDYVKESDLDIFLLCSEKDVHLGKYEQKLKRKINLLFKENYDSLSSELFNNIINGIKLRGYLKLR